MIKKRNRSVIFILIGLCLVIGTSYALWQLTLTQTGSNLLNTTCFKIDFTEDNDIVLQNAYPMSDEEGMSLTPYTFTIRNVCSTTAFYQINLEELETELKALSSSYIKVSLNDSIGKLLSTYESVEKTLDNATTSHKLTSGSLKENETQTFSLRLWLDEDTPAIDEVMNATFMSKVVIKAIHKEDIEGDIIVSATSLNEDFSNQEEVISFTGRSDKYNIIEYSIDNVIWNPVDSPAKEVTVLQTYKEDGEYTIHFKDEVGNVIEKTVSTSKLDQVPPTVNASAVEYLDGIKIDASKSIDTKSDIASYFYQLGDGEFIESSNAAYTFTGVADGEYTVHIKIKDHAGNMSDVKSLAVVIAYEHVYVSSSGNDTTGIGSMNKPFATLQRAYNKVKSGGEVILLSNLTATSTTNMNIKDKAVTLKSNAQSSYAITRANNFTSSLIIVSNSNTLTTTNITLDGNYISANGSLIEARNSILHLNEKTIIQKNINNGVYKTDFNRNDALGGGVYMYHGTVFINGASIINNKVTHSNVSQGGGLAVYGGDLHFITGNISNNEETGQKGCGGGGIFFMDGTFNMQGGTIMNNTSKNCRGGAMYLLAYEGGLVFTMTGGTIANNVSSFSNAVGGIFVRRDNTNYDSIAYIKGGVVNNNLPSGTDFSTMNGAQIIDQR